MFLDKFKGFPNSKVLAITTIITAIPFVLLTIVLILNEYTLGTTTGYGVLSFELAWTPRIIAKIFTAWGLDEMQRQLTMTYLDYLYILSYALFGAQCMLLLSRKLDGKLQDFALVTALFFVITGIFDALENVNLILMLHNKTDITFINPFLASLCATFKIGFLTAGLCILFITIIFLTIRRVEKC